MSFNLRGILQTYTSFDEGPRPFYAIEPAAIALPFWAHQLNVDTVSGAGKSAVAGVNCYFVLDHFQPRQLKNPGRDGITLITLSQRW